MTDYWERRYQSGRGSGRGSRGDFANLKANLVNETLDRYGVATILDLGCGDGQVAAMIHGYYDYLGIDPSPAAVRLAQAAAPQHRFEVLHYPVEPREAHLSSDVIRHLVDDDDYWQHLDDLFSARRLVMVWSSDVDYAWSAQERERHWTPDVPGRWKLASVTSVPGVTSEFLVYEQ